MTVLVLAQHDNGQLNKSTASVVTAALAAGDSVDVLIIGHDCQVVADQAAQFTGVSQVLLLNDAAYAHSLPEILAPVVAALANQYSHVFAPASTFGKALLPRVSGLLDVTQVSDVIAVESPTCFSRPIYAGNAIAKVEVRDTPVLATVRPTAFDVAESQETAAPINKPVLSELSEAPSVTFEGLEQSQSVRPELTAAEIVVSGGRGLKSQENFELVEQLADCLGAAVGASRAAVDAGFVSNDYQVGQTGKIVAPQLYVAIGISGAVQHLAGMKDSQVIVAINKDEEAPIFEVADYGLVGDLFEIVPQLIAALSA